MDTQILINIAYPKQRNCIDGHIGQDMLQFHLELDDDRYYLAVISRCSHCQLPTGTEYYANEENERRYAARKEPIAQ